MTANTIPALVAHWTEQCPDKIWLKDLREDGSQDYSWAESHAQICAIAAMLEARFGQREHMVVLSDNRAHWVLADMAIISSGNITVVCSLRCRAPSPNTCSSSPRQR